jgi:hypothetical protein
MSAGPHRRPDKGQLLDQVLIQFSFWGGEGAQVQGRFPVPGDLEMAIDHTAAQFYRNLPEALGSSERFQACLRVG